MKKLLFVTLLIGCVGLVYGQHKEKDIDCHNFYKENFDTLSVKGVIWEKGIIDDNYFLSVKNDQGEIIVIKLLKNNCGSLIYNFASWGSDVLKKKGERNLHIRVKYVDGSLHGRIFTNFCE